MSTVNDLESYQQFALQQQAQNNAWSAEQAQKQMDFQREMSNTAHQREVADLKAAGLNPVLSANSGASVPNGASGETDTSAAGNVGAILQQVLQAQSAREVAGMYNAATIAAAQISAGASMYGYDLQAETAREYPNSMAGIISRVIREVQGLIFPGSGSGSGPNNSNSSKSGKQVSFHPNAAAASASSSNAGTKNLYGHYSWSHDSNFQAWLRKNGLSVPRQMFASPSFMKMIYGIWRKFPSQAALGMLKQYLRR